MPCGQKTEPNLTIAELRELVGRTALTVTDSAVIEGRVVATDMAGNFYREFVMDDGTGAVAVMAGGYDLHSVYPRGIRVAVKLCGLRLITQNGARAADLCRRKAATTTSTTCSTAPYATDT